MGAKVRRLSQSFHENDNDDADAAAETLVLGYEVTPVNLATWQRLAKPLLLSGEAAMAQHDLLMNIQLKRMVGIQGVRANIANSGQAHSGSGQQYMTACPAEPAAAISRSYHSLPAFKVAAHATSSVF
jgi:hypothetical protein